jgi:hypothetical protein
MHGGNDSVVLRGELVRWKARAFTARLSGVAVVLSWLCSRMFFVTPTGWNSAPVERTPYKHRTICPVLRSHTLARQAPIAID